MTEAEAFIAGMLNGIMIRCREEGISFHACLMAARKVDARRVKAEADATPLDKPA